MAINYKNILLLMVVLLFATLACGFGTRLAEIETQVDAAVTAQAAVAQAGDIAQTAVAEAPTNSGNIVATIQASDFPEIQSLREQVASIKPDESGNYTITLDQNELNQILQLQRTLTDPNSEVQIQDPLLVFTGGYVVLYAQLTQPLEVALEVTFQPLVSDGNLQFELIEASLGPLPLPELVLSMLEATLNATLNQAINQVPTGVQLQSVIVNEGSITLVGRAG